MKMTCPNCEFSAEIPPEKVPRNGSTVLCPRCRKRFSFSLSPVESLTAKPGFLITCPSCNQEQTLGAACVSCGLVFAGCAPEAPVARIVQGTIGKTGSKPLQPPTAPVTARQGGTEQKIPSRQKLWLLAALLLAVTFLTLGLIKDWTFWNRLPFFARHETIAVVGGARHTVLLRRDGTVWAAGENYVGQLGNGQRDVGRSLPERITGLGRMNSVAAGDYHTIAVGEDGLVWAWGDNRHGQLGDATGILGRARPRQIDGLDGAVAVAAAGYYSLVLKKDGTVWCFGDVKVPAQRGDRLQEIAIPQRVPELDGIVAVAAGFNFALALKRDGTIWRWGENRLAEPGAEGSPDRAAPIPISVPDKAVAIAAGDDHALILLQDGTVWGWGVLSLPGDKAITYRDTATQLPGLRGVVAIASGKTHGVALNGRGLVFSWGNNGQNQLGRGRTRSGYLVEGYGLASVQTVFAGGYNSYVEQRDGTLLGWGFNAYGQLGDGTSQSTQAAVALDFSGAAPPSQPGKPPVEMAMNSVQRFRSLAAGGKHSAAVDLDGHVWTWGDNEWGQLGNRANNYDQLPQQVLSRQRMPLEYVVAVAAGSVHTAVALEDGSVWIWGANPYRHSGCLTTYDCRYDVKVSPVKQVVGLGKVVSLTAGYADFLALDQSHKVWIWGLSDPGQFYVAKPVPELDDVTAIASGSSHFAVLRQDGSVWSWGNNKYGQLGDGSQESRQTPQQIAGLPPVSKVVAGGMATFAVTCDGDVWGWGNLSGFNGGGVESRSSIPVRLSGFEKIHDLAVSGANGWHLLALDKNGLVWSQGANEYGQLGQGNKSFRPTTAPAPVADLRDVIQLAAGERHSLVLTKDGVVWSWGDNFAKTLGVNAVVSDSPFPLHIEARPPTSKERP